MPMTASHYQHQGNTDSDIRSEKGQDSQGNKEKDKYKEQRDRSTDSLKLAGDISTILEHIIRRATSPQRSL